MKMLVLLVFVLGSVTVHGWNAYPQSPMIFPIIFKDNRNMDMAEMETDDYRFDPMKSMRYFLHMRGLPRQEIPLGNNEILESSGYRPNKPVRMIVHGWNSNGLSPTAKIITDAFLYDDDQNVIVVDWSMGANVFYLTACQNAINAGKSMAIFMDWLVSMGTLIENLHMVGHSLGAHLIGVAGRSMTKGRVSYISALDPAGPFWSNKTERLRSTDAEYVEVIHTDSGNFGIREPIGDADFYPNRGVFQPGCNFNFVCSHGRAFELMADSIDHDGFVAIQCKDFHEMYNGRCSNISRIHMGGSRRKYARGVYYLQTNSKKPFYKN